jgi:hypothetical protein
MDIRLRLSPIQPRKTIVRLRPVTPLLPLLRHRLPRPSIRQSEQWFHVCHRERQSRIAGSRTDITWEMETAGYGYNGTFTNNLS